MVICPSAQASLLQMFWDWQVLLSTVPQDPVGLNWISKVIFSLLIYIYAEFKFKFTVHNYIQHPATKGNQPSHTLLTTLLYAQHTKYVLWDFTNGTSRKGSRKHWKWPVTQNTLESWSAESTCILLSWINAFQFLCFDDLGFCQCTSYEI